MAKVVAYCDIGLGCASTVLCLAAMMNIEEQGPCFIGSGTR